MVHSVCNISKHPAFITHLPEDSHKNDRNLQEAYCVYNRDTFVHLYEFCGFVTVCKCAGFLSKFMLLSKLWKPMRNSIHQVNLQIYKAFTYRSTP